MILAAAKVGGIDANNTLPAEFIYGNLMIEANVIYQAYAAGVERLLFLGSSCKGPHVFFRNGSDSKASGAQARKTTRQRAVSKSKVGTRKSSWLRLLQVSEHLPMYAFRD